MIEEYYPLEEGRTLTYRYRDPERTGEAAARRSVGAVSDSDKGRTAYWDEAIEGGGPAWSRGYPSLRGPRSVSEDGVKIIDAPLTPGHAWFEGADTYRIVSISETVKVPAGAYEGCLRVDYGSEDTGGGSLWFAKGVGLVKAEQNGERGPYRYELKRVG